ncbi:AAA family ATPase [Actinoplanes sp. CA-142083]|uniref:helix-turn-helix transcriptional regulator n=1 Tax=Actinoplanes sp. CA-142083 TaxID=3239903 RepID=UPI003D937517
MNLRCLLVDDNRQFLLAARNLLEREGLTVAGTAENIADAHLRTAELHPDVALVDINLGSESGFDLAARLAPTPVIMISTHSGEDYADLIAASPAIGFLSKIELSAQAVEELVKAVEKTDLVGRRREQGELEALLSAVRSGQSRALVLRGPSGSGKTALLEFLTGRARPGRVLRAAGVESESEIAYSALVQLCLPLLGHLDRLAVPQRKALSTVFGLAAGPPPERLLVGVAVLGLLAEAAADQPLLCVVDDAQWIDRASAVTLGFVARRLSGESVGLVLAARGDTGFEGIPELPVEALAEPDARALLDSVLIGPVDPRVRDRIVAETGGNPLAILELPRGLTPAELAFGFGGYSRAPLENRVEDGFRRRIAALPPETRTVLLAAAVEPVGDAVLLWRALDRLGVGARAAAPAERERLLEVGARVRFRHPLVRAAAWHSGEPAELRQVHAALAEVTDPAQDPDRRAWHRAQAVLGQDDEVAAELEGSADRARARGGWSAASAFLDRAASLTTDPARRGTLLVSAAEAAAYAGSYDRVTGFLSAAELAPLDGLRQTLVSRLRAQVDFALRTRREAFAPLLAAAQRLAAADPQASRDTFLLAVTAAMHTGRFGDDDLRKAALSARELVPAGETFPDLLLAGLVSWVLDGRTRSLPLLHRALAIADSSFIWLTSLVGYEVYRLDLVKQMSEAAIRAAVDSGALSLLPNALAIRANIMIYAGRLGEAAGMMDEIDEVIQATGASVYQFSRLVLAAYKGPVDTATALFDERKREAATRGDGRLHALACHALAILHNGNGDHRAALAAAEEAVSHGDFALGNWPLHELIEAAALAGLPEVAAAARDRLAAITAETPTPVALGIQALMDALTSPAPAAEKHYRTAIELLTGQEMTASVCRARLLFGSYLRREHRLHEARAELRAAHHAFTAMGAPGYAERAARELALMGQAVVKKRPTRVREQLTPQEAAVAQLAATGRTNQEIAAELFLSPRTVEWHLRKVFTKVGVISRRDLAKALPIG